ncbi:unnamed protein product, partial [Prorocentrum cordatum]
AAAFLRTRRRTPLTACAGGAHAQCNARQEESLSPQRRPEDAISAQIQAFPRERICSGGGGDGGKGSRTRERGRRAGDEGRGSAGRRETAQARREAPSTARHRSKKPALSVIVIRPGHGRPHGRQHLAGGEGDGTCTRWEV